MSSPISKEEFLKMLFPTAHVTEYGYCIHDWTMSPCGKYRDCLRCTEHVCIKGHPRTEALRERFVLAEELLNKAVGAAREGDYGADRWLDYHSSTVSILRGHLDILDDPTVPNDTVYQLSRVEEFSHAARAIEARSLLSDPDAKVLRSIIKQQEQGGLDVNWQPRQLSYKSRR